MPQVSKWCEHECTDAVMLGAEVRVRASRWNPGLPRLHSTPNLQASQYYEHTIKSMSELRRH
jgi:hypothetical protein